MRIASYNIHRSIGLDGEYDPQRINTVLRALQADVIALQEVGYDHQRDSQSLADFASLGQWELIEGITLQDSSGHYGNALLSRLPVRSVQRHDISVAGREPRGAIEVIVQAPQAQVQIIATHLGLRPRERRDQVQRLLSLLEHSTAPVTILLGDLNEWLLWGRPLRRLHSALGECASPATFPARWPLFALDRIWVRPLSTVHTVRVHRDAPAGIASDHLPLVAELALN